MLVVRGADDVKIAQDLSLGFSRAVESVREADG